ncbi:MAG TPA: hypothetical protein V6D17_01160 [Candidatus Obscuribacterales bacterium]
MKLPQLARLQSSYGCVAIIPDSERAGSGVILRACFPHDRNPIELNAN